MQQLASLSAGVSTQQIELSMVVPEGTPRAVYVDFMLQIACAYSLLFT